MGDGGAPAPNLGQSSAVVGEVVNKEGRRACTTRSGFGQTAPGATNLRQLSWPPNSRSFVASLGQIAKEREGGDREK